MDSVQREQLHAFVETILPPEGNRNWTRNNELEYVHSVVNRWMKKLFGFHVSPADLFAEFERGGYLINRVSMEECPDQLSAEMDHKAFSPYVDLGAWHLHVNVHVLTLRLLAESNKPLPVNAPTVKRAAQDRLNKRLARVVEMEAVQQAA